MAMSKPNKRMPTDKFKRHVIAVAKRTPGWRVKHTKCGYSLLSPDGKTVIGMHHGPSTDWRAEKNIRKECKDAGLVL
jgi:hypothetical protein